MYSTGYLHSHLYVPLAEVRDLKSLKDELTAYPKYDGDSIPMYCNKRVSEGLFGIPMCHHRNPSQIVDVLVDERTVGTEFITGKFTSTLRPVQQGVFDAFSRQVKHGKTNFILEAPPGFGKTVVTVSMMMALNMTTLIVVPRSSLLKQWIQRILDHTDLKKKDIGSVEGGEADWKGKKVVVGLVHSLVLDRYGDDFKKYFGCIMYDEVDRSVPPATFAPAVTLLPCKYRIGMSATLDRTDGMHVIFEKALGQVRMVGADEGRMKPKVIIHRYNQSSGHLHMGSNKLNRRGMLLSKLASNPERNTLIATYAKMIFVSGRRLIILSDRTEQLANLKLLLVNRFGIPERDIGFYTRSIAGKNVPEKVREHTAAHCAIILATFGLAAVGLDIPDLAGLILATPQSDIKQSKGRIERQYPGKSQPVIVDIVDSYYTDTMGWSQKRNRLYVQEGLTIKSVT